MKRAFWAAVLAVDSAIAAGGGPPPKIITCTAGPYTVQFQESAAWTIRCLSYKDKVFAVPVGWYGTVMVPAGSRWWGTGHTEGGAEVVEKLTLTVDGKEVPATPGAVVSGSKVVLVKESTIWKFKVRAETVITPEHIYERTRMVAQEPVRLGLLYYFMHSFSPTTTQWAAETPDGKLLTGEMKSDNDFEISRDTRWAAEYSPKLGLGILAYTPRVIRGRRSMTKIWDKGHYHKMYHQQNRGQRFKKDEVLDYSILIQAVPEETGDWAATRAAAAALKKQYQPVEAAEGARKR